MNKILVILNINNSIEDEEKIIELTKKYEFLDTKIFRNFNQSDKNFLKDTENDLKEYYKNNKADFLILNADVNLDEDVIQDLYDSKRTTLILEKNKHGILDIDNNLYNNLNTLLITQEDIDKYIEKGIDFLNFLEYIDIDIIVGDFKNKKPLNKQKAEELINKLLDSKFIDKKTAKKFITEKYYLEFYKDQTEGQLLSGIWMYIVDNQILPTRHLLLHKPKKDILYKKIDKQEQIIFENEILKAYDDTIKIQEEEKNSVLDIDTKVLKITKIFLIIIFYLLMITSNNIVLILIDSFFVADLIKGVVEN